MTGTEGRLQRQPNKRIATALLDSELRQHRCGHLSVIPHTRYSVHHTLCFISYVIS